MAAWFADQLACDFFTEGARAYGLPRIGWHAVRHVGLGWAFLRMLVVALRRGLAA